MTEIKKRKPTGYWSNPESIRDAAEEYKATGGTTRGGFCKAYAGAYKGASELKMLDELFPHSDNKVATLSGARKNSYRDFTDSELAKLLSTYTRRKAAPPKAVLEARRRGRLDKWLPRGKAENWNLKTALSEARKYTTLSEFQKGASGAYNFIRINGHLDRLYEVVPPAPRTGNIVWTEARLRKLAKHFKGEFIPFRKEFPGAEKALRERYPALLEELFPNRRRWRYWNIDSALKYLQENNFANQTELRAENTRVYALLRDSGKLDKLLPKRPPKWNLESLSALMQDRRFDTAAELRKSFPAAYIATRELGLIESWFPTPKPMTLADAKVIAASVSSRTELAAKSRAAYKLLKEAELLDMVLPTDKTYWNEKKVVSAASDKQFLSSFVQECPGAYGWILKHRRHDLVAHLENRYPSDRDTVYIWKAEGIKYKKKSVYKFGVTSARLKTRRIKQVARANNMKAKVILIVEVGARADFIEGMLLSFGVDPKLQVQDGATEFRALTESQLKQAMDFLSSVATGKFRNTNAVFDGCLPSSGRRKKISLAEARAVADQYTLLKDFRSENESLYQVIRNNIAQGAFGWQELLDSLAKTGQSGAANGRHDPTRYRWRHKDGQVVCATRYEMNIRFKLPSSATCMLLSGRSKTQHGWFLADKFESYEQIEALKRDKISKSQKGKHRPQNGRSVICLTTNKKFLSCADAAEWLGKKRKFGIKISEAAAGKRPRAGGHSWAYL